MNDGKRLTDDLTALTQTGAKPIQSQPAPEKPRAAIPAATGKAFTSGGGGTGGGGIASPLTETDYLDREWYAERNLVSSDGLFTIKASRLKKLVMGDANDSAVELNFKDVGP